MLTDLFKVYHAKGIFNFTPDAIIGREKFRMDDEEYDFMTAYVLEHDEHGSLAFREVNTLSRVDGDDDEWVKMTGYYDQRISMAVNDKSWAAMDVYQAIDPGSAVYRYMLRWEDCGRVFPYLVKDHMELADLVSKLKVLCETKK